MVENDLMRNHMKKVNKILINTFWVGVIMHLSYVLMGVTVNKNLLRVAILVLSNLLAIALNKNERTEKFFASNHSDRSVCRNHLYWHLGFAHTGPCDGR